MSRLGILGAGSWGTALAAHLAGAGGHSVALWARDPELARRMAGERCNPDYLPGVEIPAGVVPTSDMADLAASDIVLIVVPSHGFRAVLRQFLAVTGALRPAAAPPPPPAARTERTEREQKTEPKAARAERPERAHKTEQRTARAAGTAGPEREERPERSERVEAREPREEPGADRRLILVSATKGIETETLARMSQVAAEEAAAAGQDLRFAVLAGPSFASELARDVPSAVVIASEDAALATAIREALSTPTMRLYSSPDVIGAELGGASKNVIAIAAGAVSGLGLGDNTLAALITRGLHEITRLGVACGGQTRTFAGLAGLGDLVLTCTGALSRNRRAGVELAAGKTRAEIAGETHMVAEGIRNSLAIARLAALRGVEMPITEQMVAVMYQGKDPRRAVEELMTRGLKAEAEL